MLRILPVWGQITITNQHRYQLVLISKNVSYSTYPAREDAFTKFCFTRCELFSREVKAGILASALAGYMVHFYWTFIQANNAFSSFKKHSLIPFPAENMYYALLILENTYKRIHQLSFLPLRTPYVFSTSLFLQTKKTFHRLPKFQSKNRFRRRPLL